MCFHDLGTQPTLRDIDFVDFLFFLDTILSSSYSIDPSSSSNAGCGFSVLPIRTPLNGFKRLAWDAFCFLSINGCRRFRGNVTSLKFSVISKIPQNLGWRYLEPEPSANETCFVECKTLTLNGAGSRFLFACMDILSLHFAMVSLATFTTCWMWLRKSPAEAFVESNVSNGIVRGCCP